MAESGVEKSCPVMALGAINGHLGAQKEVQEEDNTDCGSSLDKGFETDSMVFESVELLSLYTVMDIKCFWGRNLSKAAFQEHLCELVGIVESNLTRLKVAKKWFFATLRDHSRIYLKNQSPAKECRTSLDSVLLTVALRLGMEALWNSEDPHAQGGVLAEGLAPRGSRASLALRELDRREPLFDLLVGISPGLQRLFLPRSDAHLFREGVTFSSLRVIEMSGYVSDKVMCKALWNVDKKSHKVLHMALKKSKEAVKWNLSLPHLEVLRSNLKQGRDEGVPMRLALGAAALVVQPNMRTVETGSWDTLCAVAYLLDKEAKQKQQRSSAHQRTLGVTHLALSCLMPLDLKRLKEVVAACPKVTSLTLNMTKDIHQNLSLLCAVLPFKQIRVLTLEATLLTNLELTVLLAEMRSLEELTLQLSVASVTSFKLPIERETRRLMVPSIKKLTVEFEAPELDEEEQDSEARDMMGFLASFPALEELSFSNTIFVQAPYLVYGCIGGALAVLPSLRHLSVLAAPGDLPREWVLRLKDSCSSHFSDVPPLLTDLQAEATFKHLRELETLVLDEVYLAPNVDDMILALRVARVLVGVHYRPGRPGIYAGGW